MENSNIVLTKQQLSQVSVPYWNAVAWKKSIENGYAPFLPDKEGNVNAEPIYKFKGGYCLDGNELVMAQIKKAENGYASNVVATFNQINGAKTSVNKSEHGIQFNFKDKEGNYHSSRYFFPEQTAKPENLSLPVNGNAIAKSGNEIMPNSASPADYMAAYLTACKTGATFKVTPELASEFKNNIMPILENQTKKVADRDASYDSMPKLNNIMHEAVKKHIEQMNVQKEQNHAPVQQKERQHKRSVSMGR